MMSLRHRLATLACTLLLLPTAASAVTVSLLTDKSEYTLGETITFTATATPSFSPFGSGVTNLTLTTGQPGDPMQSAASTPTATFTALADTVGDFTAILNGAGFSNSFIIAPIVTEIRDIVTRVCILGSCFNVVTGQETVVIDPGGPRTITNPTSGSATAAYSVVAPIPLPATGLLLLAPLAVLARRKRG